MKGLNSQCNQILRNYNYFLKPVITGLQKLIIFQNQSLQMRFFAKPRIGFFTWNLLLRKIGRVKFDLTDLFPMQPFSTR